MPSSCFCEPCVCFVECRCRVQDTRERSGDRRRLRGTYNGCVHVYFVSKGKTHKRKRAPHARAPRLTSPHDGYMWWPDFAAVGWYKMSVTAAVSDTSVTVLQRFGVLSGAVRECVSVFVCVCVPGRTLGAQRHFVYSVDRCWSQNRRCVWCNLFTVFQIVIKDLYWILLLFASLYIYLVVNRAK